MPRLRIEPGSVGIGGISTGVILSSPLADGKYIGRTPLALFWSVTSEQPSLLQAEIKIYFEPISYEAFMAWEEQA